MRDPIDFVEWLNSELSFQILSSLNNPADVVRVSSVSRSWRQFVIASEFSKILCLRLFPETSIAVKAIEENNVIQSMECETNGSIKVEKLKKNHRIYALLARGLAPSSTKECILEAISASSTYSLEDNIHQTLIPGDIFQGRFSYWSSTGKSTPEVPEMLMYRLVSKLCFISEINIQPCQAYFDDDCAIYSDKAVRFRMGYAKEPQLEKYLMGGYGLDSGRVTEDHVVWTYTSEKFPMVQKNCFQKFKLPEPVLAIGGLLQIELLGRDQLATNGLYYLCVAHVQVVGRPLTDDFIAELIDHSGKCTLKYNPETATCNDWRQT